MHTADLVSIDCTGTTTVAALRHQAGQIEPLRFDGSAELPSGVHIGPDGRILTGRDALDAAIVDPTRFIATPLRLLEAAPDPAGGDPDPTLSVAAVLGRVREQASLAADVQVTRAILLTPPGWGPRRRTRLRTAAHSAGLTEVEFVDAATAIAQHHLSTTANQNEVVLVCRVVGTRIEASVLRPGDSGFEPVATLSVTDPDTLDGHAATDHAASLAGQALAAAELSFASVTTTLLQAPPAHLPGIASRLRERGIIGATRTVADTDAVYGALATTAASVPAWPRRQRASHALALVVPVPAALALLWLLLQTGVIRPAGDEVSFRYPPPPYMTTLWPAWSMVAVLVLTGAVTIVLTLADRRVRTSPQQTETERRRRLARGLQISAAVSVASGLATTMLATVSYQIVPVSYFLLWTTVPALILAGITALVATLVQRGHTSAARWQIWLHLPTTTTVLAIAGLLTVHAYLYTNIVPNWYLYHPRLPHGIDQLGATAIASAILPLMFRRLDNQVLASPIVIATIIWTHSYSNTALLVGLLLAADILWWITRIRPAAAYNDPEHLATHMASELEPTVVAPSRP